MVFGTAEDVSGLENTRAEDAVSRYMMGAWAAFARDAKVGLREFGWPEYKPKGKAWYVRCFRVLMIMMLQVPRSSSWP
jgi:carboxylesterase type B